MFNRYVCELNNQRVTESLKQFVVHSLENNGTLKYYKRVTYKRLCKNAVLYTITVQFF